MAKFIIDVESGPAIESEFLSDVFTDAITFKRTMIMEALVRGGDPLFIEHIKQSVQPA